MLNWLVRYAPIAGRLRKTKPARVLDVGSGAEGVRMFWRGRVVGADIRFKRRPLHDGVAADAERLPFPARSFPVVVSCDFLEHLPAENRPRAVLEMSRVAQDMLLIAFPSGGSAAQFYASFAGRYGDSPPDWLGDHLAFGLPAAEEVQAWLQAAGWETELVWYEDIARHQLLLDLELRLGAKWLTYPLMRFFGPMFIPAQFGPGRGPYLRALIVGRRKQ